jgi:hypothetical protein
MIACLESPISSDCLQAPRITSAELHLPYDNSLLPGRAHITVPGVVRMESASTAEATPLRLGEGT